MVDGIKRVSATLTDMIQVLLFSLVYLVDLIDFWRFNGQTRNWTSLATGPAARWFHCLEWNQGSNQLILFGGVVSARFDDLWSYSIESDQWQLVTPVGSSVPAGRFDHACTFNTQLSTFHVHGGWGLQNYQDLWQFNFTSNIWTLISSGDSNVVRARHSMRYSRSLNSLILIHGFNSITNSFTNTIYQYSFNNESVGWTLFQVSGSQPSGRGQYSTGFNPQTGEYFMFGGYNGTEFFSIHIYIFNCRSFISKMLYL
jgi:hypothetical protein